MKNEKRKMIIVWKWEELKPAMTDEILSKKENSNLLENLDAGNGIYYKEFPVEKSESTADGMIIAANIKNTGEKARMLLQKLIDAYSDEAYTTILFLHRGHSYDIDDVKRILEVSSNLYKCFLFSDGRDYIYYDTKNDGLLGHTGKFYRGYDEKYIFYEVLHNSRKEKDEKQYIRQPHFDRVWTYYRNESEQKLFMLKEDLFDALLPLFNKDDRVKTIPYKNINDNLESSKKYLKLRIKSFLDYYDDKNLKSLKEEQKGVLVKELEALKAYEKRREQSYTLDDWQINLKSLAKQEEFKDKGIEAINERIKVQFEGLINGTMEEIPLNHLHQLSADLEELVIIIPGEMD